MSGSQFSLGDFIKGPVIQKVFYLNAVLGFLHDYIIKMRGAKASCTGVGQLPKLTGQQGSKPYFGVAFGGGGGQAAAGEPGSLGVSGGWGGAGCGGRGEEGAGGLRGQKMWKAFQAKSLF